MPLLSAHAVVVVPHARLLYGVHLAVVFYVVIVAREFFAMDVLSPGWVSVRLLAWLRRGAVGRRGDR